MRCRCFILAAVFSIITTGSLPVLGESGIHSVADSDGLTVIESDTCARELWKVDRTGKPLDRLSGDLDVRDYLISRDGNEIIILASSSGDVTLDRNAFLVDLSTGQTRKLTEGLYGSSLLAWRPGHAQVILSRTHQYAHPDLPDSDGGVWMLDVRIGKLSKLIGPCDADHPMARKAVFDKSGNRLAVMRGGMYTAVFDLNRPGSWWLLPFHASAIQDLAWIDSDKLALALAQGRWEESVRDAHGSRKTVSTTHPGGVWIWELDKTRKRISPQDADIPTQSPLPPSSTGYRLVGQKGESIYSLAISPSGRKIAYIAQSGLYVSALTNPKPHRILLAKDVPDLDKIKQWYTLNVPRGSLYSLEFSPDESHVSLRDAWVPLTETHKQRL